MRPALRLFMRWLAASTLLLALGCAATPKPPPLPLPPPLPPPPPVVLPPGPGGSTEAMALGPEARGKPVQLGLTGGAKPKAIVVFDSLAVEIQPMPLEAGQGQPLSVPVVTRQLVAERLLSAASGSRLTLALGLADENHEIRILGTETSTQRRLPDLRPCAVAAGESASIVVAEKAPKPGSSSADLVLVTDSGPPVALGAHATGDLCGAAVRGDGFFVAWNDAKGRLLVRAVDARGRSAGATVALPLPADERLVSPSLAPVAGAALLVATSRKDGAVRGFALDVQGRAHGGILTIAPSDGQSETGGASVVAVPEGGFAIAWYAARPGGDASPTTIRLAWLDAAELPIGTPIDLLAPLALASGPAPLAGIAGGALVGGIVIQDGTPLARVVRVPQPEKPAAPAPAR